MKKRILFATCVCAFLLAFSLFAGAADIGSANDLLTLMNTPSMWTGDYTLTADIDLTAATNGLSQAPIGNATTAFTGSFDGDGHWISGIAISGSTKIGLFGCALNATIENLTVYGSVTGTGNIVGGLIGYVGSAAVMVENCTNYCTVTGVDSVGGIIGRLEPASNNARVAACRNGGEIHGARYTGGIVGFHSQTSGATVIEQCYNAGAVEGSQGVAGIVGFFRVYTGAANKCYVQDCMNTGATHATAAYAGGILGWGHNKNFAYTLTRCLNTGAVSCDAASYVRPNAGVISKATSDAGKMSYCYYTSTGSYTAESDCYANLYETYVADATVAWDLAGLGENWVVVNGHAPELRAFHTHDTGATFVAVGGVHTKTCYCGEVIVSEAHIFDGGVCIVCGAEDIPCEHENSYEIIVCAATCTSSGSKYVYCPDCDTQIGGNIEIPADPNNHSGILVMACAGGAVTYTCNVCGAVVYTDNAPLSTVYVSASGKELTGTVSAKIGTAENPFKNFTDAMQYAAYNTADVMVVILDTAEAPATYHTPAFTNTVTVTGGTLVTHTRFILHGPMVFEHICFADTGNPFFAAQEHKIVMGEGITVSGGAIYLVGGYEHGTATNADIPATGFSTDVTVRSGVYHGLAGGNRYLGGAYAGNIRVVLGKTNPADTLTVTSTLAVASFNGEGGNGVNATFIFDGNVDSIASFCPITHASSANGHFDIDIVVRGGASLEKSNVLFRGSDYALNVYADPRIEGAEDLAATIIGAENVQPYRRYCLKVNGTHPDVNEDGVCDTCGSPTVCDHSDGEWVETVAANCTSPVVYTWYCLDCKELIPGMTDNGESVDTDNHVADHFVWNYDGTKYYFVCTSCAARVEQSAAPTVYVSADGNDRYDGRTPAKAVATLAEAVGRIANVGGSVAMVGAYPLTADLSLPAYTKPITLCGYDADDGNAPGGFTAGANYILSLGGETTIENISFFGGRRFYIVANWNNLTFGKVFHQNSSYAYVILGSYPATVSDNAAKTATLTITESATAVIAPDGSVTRNRFYERVYLGSIFGADHLNASNKNVTLNATDAEIGVLYTISTSSSYRLCLTDNCEATVNLYGGTTVNQGRTGDANASYATSKGMQKNLTLNLFDDSAILTDCYIRNAEYTVINISKKADGRTLAWDIPFAFYAFGDFAANGRPVNVSIDYSTHTIAPSLDAPCVFSVAANAVKTYTENVEAECVYDVSITVPATPETNGTKLYSCTCGRSYTEPFAYSCTDSTHVYLAKADGSYECTACGGSFGAVSG
ncbi:MAG: hypothetical protein IJS44_06265, partial [Clostridia bacterium]|nr:hypothetical protein [Clostridia bacterium]